jgi:hypothetical protein
MSKDTFPHRLGHFVVHEAAEEGAIHGVAHAVGGYLGHAVGGLSVPLLLTNIAKFALNEEAIYRRNKAREVLKCQCIQVCPKGYFEQQTEAMRRYADQERGMSFLFDGVGLCHPENDFDVKQLSTFVIRWCQGRARIEFRGMHLRPCWKCANAAQHAGG